MGRDPTGNDRRVVSPGRFGHSVLEMAADLYPTHRLSYVDAHTVGLQAGGVTYVPIPPGSIPRYVGLLTAGLPAGIKKGQEFEVVVRQLTTRSFGRETLADEVAAPSVAVAKGLSWQRVLGSFKLTIPIGTKSSLLGTEGHLLSVMRWIGATIPVESPWFLVFQRYLVQLGGRVGEMGGNPGAIKPSPTGGIIPGRGGTHGGGAGMGDGHDGGDDRYEVTGKIEGLMHDRFGDFEGFVLALRSSGEHRRLYSHEDGIAALAERAWQHRTTVSVLTADEHSERPIEIILW